MKRFTSDDRNDKSRGFAPAERNVEGEPVGPSFEGVVGEGILSRRRMLGLAGGALAGVLLTPLSLSEGEASANQVSPRTLVGTYTIRQKSNGRYLDAYQSSSNDFAVVTRLSQRNDTQRWLLDVFQSATGTFYRIRQKSSGRYLDAYQSSSNDFAVVTRDFQSNDTQRWLLTRFQSATGTFYRIRQKSNGRYLDAYQSSSNDFAVVTRDFQSNDTQRWLLQRVA